MKMRKMLLVIGCLAGTVGVACAGPIGISGTLSLSGLANIDTSTLASDPTAQTIEFTAGSPLIGGTGSFAILGSSGTVTFNNEGTPIPYLTLTSNSNLSCGSGCIYTVAANGYTSTFDLTTEAVTFTGGGSFMQITGTGTATLMGPTSFSPTEGFFSLSTQALAAGGTATNVSFSTTTSVPEPGTLALFGAGLLGCAAFIGRRRRSLRDRV